MIVLAAAGIDYGFIAEGRRVAVGTAYRAGLCALGDGFLLGDNHARSHAGAVRAAMVQVMLRVVVHERFQSR